MVGYGITGSNAQDSGYKRTADMTIAEVYQEIVIMEDFKRCKTYALATLVVLHSTIWLGIGSWWGLTPSPMEAVKRLKQESYQ